MSEAQENNTTCSPPPSSPPSEEQQSKVSPLEEISAEELAAAEAMLDAEPIAVEVATVALEDSNSTNNSAAADVGTDDSTKSSVGENTDKLDDQNEEKKIEVVVKETVVVKDQGQTEQVDREEAPEVTSSTEPTTKTNSANQQAQQQTSHHQHSKPSMRHSSRRPSYNSNTRHGYIGAGGGVGNFQNYGLTYLPYKSNFEPSEDARRKADEFLKTLKL